MFREVRLMLVFGLVAALLLGTLVTATAAQKKDRFFTVTLITPIGRIPREKAGQIIARDLEKIGIGVNLRYMEYASITPRWQYTAQTGATAEEGGYDMYITQTALDSEVDPSGIYHRFASDQYYPDGKNQVRYSNSEFDSVIYEALGTADDQKRWTLCRKAEGIIYDTLPSIPLWFPTNFYGIRSTVQFPEGHDPNNWNSYSLKWAWRELGDRTKKEASLRERTLIFAQPSDTDVFLPGYTGTGFFEFGVGYLAYDHLIQAVSPSLSRGPEEEHTLRPALAKSWENSEDGRVWTIHLQKNAYWHDDEPFTADDVIFTFDLLSNPAAGYGSDKFIRMNGITWEKLDDYTVRFSCEKFSPLFANEMFDGFMLANHILPEHLLEAVPPEELARSDFNTGGTVIGTGPWILEEYRPAEYIKYRANEKYYGKRPWFDYVVIRIIPRPATAWYALKTGEVDVTIARYGFTRELAEAEADPNLYAVQEPQLGAQMIRINNDHPNLSDIWVRRAISLACNREVMVNVISNGLGLVAGQHLPPSSPGYNPELSPLDYCLNEAKRMMEKAGYDYDTITIEGPSE